MISTVTDHKWQLSRVLVVAILFCCPAHCAQAEDTPIAVIAQGCRSAVDALRCGKGRLTEHRVQYRPGGGVLDVLTTYDVVFSGSQYKLSGTRTYLRNQPGPDEGANDLFVAPGTVIHEVFCNDGQEVSYYRPDKSHAYKAALGSRSQATARQTFVSSLVSVAGRGVYIIDEPVPLSSPENVTDKGLRVVRSENMGGNECVVVERSFTFPLPSGETATRTFVYWVDTSRGFTVPKAQRWIQGGDYGTKTLISETSAELKEYSDGRWGPQKWQMVQYGRGLGGVMAKVMEEHIEFDAGFQFNGDITGSDLAMTLPSGTFVTDESLDAVYEVP